MATLLVTAAINVAIALLVSFLFAPDGPDVQNTGPRTDDLNVTSSAYGKNRHLGYGTHRLNGNVFWSPGIQEVVNVDTQESGKGGGGGSVTTTTYSYFASFAIGFGVGPATALLRIWADNKLIYDVSDPQDPDVPPSGSMAAAIVEQIYPVSDNYKVRFYPGDGAHNIDPLIQADTDGKFGVGSTPDYGNEVFFVADNWALGNFANRIPNITAEISYLSVTSLPYIGLQSFSSHDYPGSAAGGATGYGMQIDPFSNKLYFLKRSGYGLGIADGFQMVTKNLILATGATSQGSFVTKDGILYVQTDGGNSSVITGYEPISGAVISTSSFTLGNGIRGGGFVKEFPGTGLPPVKFIVMTRKGVIDTDGYTWADVSGNPSVYAATGSDLTPNARGLVSGEVLSDWFNNVVYVIMENSTQIEIHKGAVELGIGLTGPETNITWTIVLNATKASLGMTTDSVQGCIFLPSEDAVILGQGDPDTGGTMIKFDTSTWAVIASTNLFGFSVGQQWSNTGRWACVENDGSGGLDARAFIFDTDSLELIKIQDTGVAFPTTDANASHRSSNYDPRFNSITYSRFSGSGNYGTEIVVKIFLDRASGLGVPLDGVVGDLCERAGLLPDDYDVTDLAGDSVRGYIVSRPGSYRSAIEPLQRVFLFEGVETDWKLKFVKRGATPTETIVEDDIGRLGDKEQIEEKRLQEVELPSLVTVQFPDSSKDYEQSTAYDKRVSNPTPSQYARSEMKIETPIVLDVTEAKQLASAALFASWSERLSIDSSLPWRYIRYDPADVVNMIFRGETRQIRMGEVELGSDLSIDFNAVQEDVSTYVSTVTGTAGDGFIPKVATGGLPSVFIPANLPLLLAPDATLGTTNRVYFGVAGYEASWPGVSLFRSLDVNVTFQQLTSFNVECSWGSLKSLPPDLWNPDGLASSRKGGGQGGFTWDDETTIDVIPFRGVDRWVTSTDAEVLEGDNAFAIIHNDGTVEVIQFVVATEIIESNQEFIRLSRLLRGRRGTEDYANGRAAIGNTVMLLEDGRISSWRNELSRVDITLPYKAVTASTLIEDTSTTNFQSNGEDLRPYSVVNIDGQRSGGDLTLTWERRTRFNGELLADTGEVPLNEEILEYDVDYYLQGALTPFLQRTVSTETDILTAAEFTAIFPVGTDQLQFTNWNFEVDVGATLIHPTGWEDVAANSGNWISTPDAVGSIAGPTGAGGTNYAVITTDNTTSDFAAMVTTKKWSFIDDYFRTADEMDAAPTIDLDVYTTNPSDSTNGTQVDLRIYDENDNIIQTITSGRIIGTPGTWINTTVLATAVVSGARKFDVLVTADNDTGLSFDQCTGAVDRILIELNGIGVVPPAIDAIIYQKSNQVGRGKATRQRV